ncbi:MAG: phosphotransferase [Terriglobales bacterium]
MHELVWELSRREKPASVLLQLPLDGGALLAAFDPRAQGQVRWLAKTGYGEAACRRLRAEARALTMLAGHAGRLHLPELVGFRESGTGNAATACLVQSGMPGQIRIAAWSGRAWADFDPVTEAALSWLGAWQQTNLSPGPERVSLAELGARTATRADADMERFPQLAALLRWIPDLMSVGAVHNTAVAVHGDFWAGNLLLQSRGWGWKLQLGGVVDWSGFGAGSALDDLLNWFTQLRCGPRRRRWEAAETWLRVLFCAGRPRQCLRLWAGQVGYAPASARYAFYLFVARRLSWELGLDLQARSMPERQQARQKWSGVLAWLARHGYPDPFSGGEIEAADSGGAGDRA